MAQIEDSRPRQLVVRTSSDGDGLIQLDVQDVGTGLSPHLADKLFEPFNTTKEDGMGMGLFVSRSIIERHGGRLWVTPNEEHGVTFSFAIPRNAN
jgi:signal transduction histidine kinase